MSLRKAGVTSLSFEGRGERIARGFYIPVLKESVAYDRATGYFSVESLVHAASGVAGLIGNGGRMRLILGAHDVPKELWEAYQMGLRSGKDIVEELASDLEIACFPNGGDDYIGKVATTQIEALNLIEAGFEHVCVTPDGTMYFRKRR